MLPGWFFGPLFIGGGCVAAFARRRRTRILGAVVAVGVLILFFATGCAGANGTIGDLATAPLPADSATRADRVGLLHHGIDGVTAGGVARAENTWPKFTPPFYGGYG